VIVKLDVLIPLLFCDDNNPCTNNSCCSVLGCQHSPIDDEDVFIIDACDDETGTISHIPVNYDDNACSIDSCDEQTGNFLHETIDCDDNDACT